MEGNAHVLATVDLAGDLPAAGKPPEYIRCTSEVHGMFLLETHPAECAALMRAFVMPSY